MSMLDHANILKTYGIFLSDSTNPPSILLEFCGQKRRTCQNHLPNCRRNEVHPLQKKVIHRDLKPTNILIMSDGTVKIYEFGILKLMKIEEQKMTRGIGSQKFMTPEIINEEDYYDEKS